MEKRETQVREAEKTTSFGWRFRRTT